MTSKGIVFQPVVQHCAFEHAILIPKADPDEDPGERFSVVAVQVCDLALECCFREKVMAMNGTVPVRSVPVGVSRTDDKS